VLYRKWDQIDTFIRDEKIASLLITPLINFHHTTLSNGLEIVAETNEAAYSAAIGFYVKTGARDETPEIAGVSHFLEHLVFKGAQTSSAEEVNRRLDEMGADSNAYTSEEHTMYYGAVLPELIGDFIELTADLLRPALRPEDIELERQVVLEEIGMYEDTPPFGTDEICRELFFKGHPLGNSILGTVKSVNSLDRETLLEYCRRQYSPDNIVVVGCGQIDFARMTEQVERCCGSWKASSASRHRNFRRVRGKRGFHPILKESATLQYTMLLVDGPSCTEADRYAAELLSCILGDESGSRLFWELVDPGWVDSLGLSVYEYLDNGVFLTGMSCDPDLYEKNINRIAEVYRLASAKGFAQDELERARSKTCSRIVLGNERPKGRLFSVGNDWVVRRRYNSVREELDQINAVTLDDLHAVLRKYPLDQPLTLTIGPKRFR